MAELSKADLKRIRPILNKNIKRLPSNLRQDEQFVGDLTSYVYLAYGKYDPSKKATLETFLTFCFKNRMYTLIKSRNTFKKKHAISTRTLECISDSHGAHDPVSIEEILEPLTTQQRQVVIDRVINNYTYKEMSEDMNLKPTQVRQIYRRAIERLASYDSDV